MARFIDRLAFRRVCPLLVASLVCFGCQRQSPAPPPDAAPATAATAGTVTIEIESGGQTETIQIDDVAEGTTLESLMRSIDQVPIKMRGSGPTAFVESIGEQSTSGSMGWTYKIDGKFANQGVGSKTLTPPATVTWSYGDAREAMEQ